MTDAGICNMALGFIGAETISALDEGSQVANQCTVYYEQSRDELLRLVAWNFAIERQDLTALSEDTTEYDEWSYAFVLPTDPKCLRVLGLVTYDSLVGLTVPNPTWAVEGSSVLCNDDNLTLLYIKQITDPNKFDPLFVRTFSYHLASTLAMAVKQSREIRDVYYGLFREALYEARRINKTERRNLSSSGRWNVPGEEHHVWPNIY